MEKDAEGISPVGGHGASGNPEVVQGLLIFKLWVAAGCVCKNTSLAASTQEKDFSTEHSCSEEIWI